MNKVLSFLTVGLMVVAVGLFVFGHFIGHVVCTKGKDGNPHYQRITATGLVEIRDAYIEGPVHFLPPYYANEVLVRR